MASSPWRTRAVCVGACSVAAVVLSACGASPTAVKSTTTAPLNTISPTSGTRPTPPPLSSLPVNPTTTIAPFTPGLSRCVTSDFQPSWDDQGDGASQAIYFVVNLLNISGASCDTGGYFSVSAYDPNGQLLTSTDERNPLGEPSPELTVPPGGSISFSVGFADVSPPDGDSCAVTVGAIHLIPPNDTNEVQVATPDERGGYPSLCSNQIGVGPVRSGARPS
jgi:hypothetical protein